MVASLERFSKRTYEMDDWPDTRRIFLCQRTHDGLLLHIVQARCPAKSKSIMNPTYLPALAALSGSAVGGLTSFLSSWLGQSTQLRAQVFINDKSRRQELYREFVDEASKGYIDSITTNTPDLTRLVALYALISRMRSLSSRKVIEEAEKVAQLIVRSYPEPNMTFADLRPMITAKAIDPLRSFAESCREELEGLK